MTLSKKEFNIRFLLATRRYMARVAVALVRECRGDVEAFGLAETQRKWAAFIEEVGQKEGAPIRRKPGGTPSTASAGLAF